MWNRPAASIAPVFPAETTASASPSPTARQAATSELSGFARTASTGFSCIAITSGASTSSRPCVSRPAGPKRIGSICVGGGLERAGDDLVGAAIAAHGVDGDADRIVKLRSRRSERLDLAAAVRLAGRADAVRPLRLVADRALVHARRLQAMRRPPLVAAGLRLSALRDCHGRARSIATGRFSPRFQALPRLCLRVARAWSALGTLCGHEIPRTQKE